MDIGLHKIKDALELFAQIKPNLTINIYKMALVSHNSYIGSAKRLLFRENRFKTIETIERIVDSAIVNLPREIDLLILLKNAKNGINNLKHTYYDDDEMKERINSCVTRIDNVCTRFENRLMTSIEQISDELKSRVNVHEYDNLILVRQTPILTPKTPSTPINLLSPKDTPQETPIYTPKDTAPPTPASTPTRDLSPIKNTNEENWDVNLIKNRNEENWHLSPIKNRNEENWDPIKNRNEENWDLNSRKNRNEERRDEYDKKKHLMENPFQMKNIFNKPFPKISNNFSFTDPTVSMALKLGPIFQSPFLKTQLSTILQKKNQVPNSFRPMFTKIQNSDLNQSIKSHLSIDID